MNCDDNDEVVETPLGVYVEENKGDLVKAFVDDNQELFEEFMKQYGTDTHGKHIQEGFAEYHYELFNRFCSEIYNEIVDDFKTKISCKGYE